MKDDKRYTYSNTILTRMHMQTALDWTTGVTLVSTWCL